MVLRASKRDTVGLRSMKNLTLHAPKRIFTVNRTSNAIFDVGRLIQIQTDITMLLFETLVNWRKEKSLLCRIILSTNQDQLKPVLRVYKTNYRSSIKTNIPPMCLFEKKFCLMQITLVLLWRPALQNGWVTCSEEFFSRWNFVRQTFD